MLQPSHRNLIAYQLGDAALGILTVFQQRLDVFTVIILKMNLLLDAVNLRSHLLSNRRIICLLY